MNSEAIPAIPNNRSNLVGQYRELSELQTAAFAAQAHCQQLQVELHEHSMAVAAEEAAARTRAQQRQQRLLQASQDAVDQRLALASESADGLREALQKAAASRQQERTQRHSEAVAAIRSKLQNELWVLKEVLDEGREDSPLSQAERARDNFETQDTALKQRLDDVDTRLNTSADWLKACHAAHEANLPAATIQAKTRDTARTESLEWIDKLVISAAGLNRLTLPQWVLGLRLYGLGLFVFLCVTVVSLVLRADVTLFLNPGIGKPDWQWLGVSCLIGFGVTFLFVLVLLSSVQSRLRGEFEEMLQQAANARAAAELWRSKSRTELRKLEHSAEQWATENIRRRQAREQALEATANAALHDLDRDQQIAADNDALALQRDLQSATADLTRETTEIERSLQQEQSRIQQESQQQLNAELAALQQTAAARRQSLECELATVFGQWRNNLAAARLLAAAATDRAASSTDWTTLLERGWSPPTMLPRDVVAGIFASDFPSPPPPSAKPAEPLPAAPVRLHTPALLRFPTDLSIAIQHDAAGRDPALDFLRMLLLRLLTSVIPGRLQFTLIDPGGLGQSFSALMHLADFDELLIDSRIWTDASQIRERLQKVTEHMENVFQTYLRSEFETIEDYNAAAGEVAEPYHFVVIAGFPAGFTEESGRHLASILTSGARCGVHVLMTWSPEQPFPRTFDPAILRSSCLLWNVQHGIALPTACAGTQTTTDPTQAVLFTPQAPPDAARYVALVRSVGTQSKDARRVEVSFSRIAPKPSAVWSLGTADGIDLPIGRAGAARLQYLRLGRGTSQHVLIAGKTGSGKSTLMHILITNLALFYNPQEIQFYLIDFKKGVEFRAYAACGLPHARVIAIESDREFGLSVLERLDAVLQERGELFRQRGVQDVPSFRREYPRDVLPRLLLLIDEFQEFFTAEDRVSGRAALLLDRLIRQGRAFGIHVVLGSQTLGGAYSLARSTLGQVAIRIALQCSESDAHLILSEDNSAARLLTRPGEAIYNDANGMVEGNHPFQIAWLDEDHREELLSGLKQRPEAVAAGRTLVFEGNIPPRIEDCEPLNALKAGHQPPTDEALSLWIGEPVSIAAPVCVQLRRSAGQNLILAGQEPDQADAIFAAIISSSVARSAARLPLPRVLLLHDARDQTSLQQFQQTFLDQQPADSRVFELHTAEAADDLIADCWKLLKAREATAGETADEVQSHATPEDDLWSTAALGRTSAAPSPSAPPEEVVDDGRSVILLVRNIGQYRSLRKDDDDFGMGSFGAPKAVTPASRFSDLIRRGPQNGIHVVIWSDTFANLIRWISTSLLREFDYRIAFRLNQTDSASLLDTPAAATLVPGRAILYQDQTGESERFRPWQWTPRSSGQAAAIQLAAVPPKVSPAATPAATAALQSASHAGSTFATPNASPAAAPNPLANSGDDLPEFPDINDLLVV